MKRHLLIITVFLLAGAVVNVAVAWGLAAWGWRRPHTPVDPAAFRLAAQRVWDQYSPEGSPPFKEPYIVTKWGWTAIAATYYPPSPCGGFAVGELKAGLPMRTLQCGWYHSYEDGRSVMFNGWPNREKPPLIIPYEPIWPAFAVNTLFYAAILWLFIGGPFVLRRFLRVRRGLCPKCAYPMGESSVCTECGGALAKRAVA